MNDHERLNPGHTNARDVLRVVGPLLVGLGLILTVTGVGSVFASFGTFGSPRLFWCAFIGLPMLFLGAVMCKFAFMGRLVRYMASETAPVAKDTFNYMADGTQQGVRTMASAIGQGLRDDGSESRCGKCGQTNDADARFCQKCGAGLATTCPACSRPNKAEANFCDACGSPLAPAPKA